MRRDQPQSVECEHSTRKRKRRNTLFNNYIYEFAEQFATREKSINGKNVSNGSSQSQSQHVWLMIVDRLRKEVLNARDCHRADTLARARLLTPPPPSSSYKCSVCKENKSVAKTVCTHFLCWECLCKWHKKGPSKKECPCCPTILSKSHIAFIGDKPDLSNNTNINTNTNTNSYTNKRTNDVIPIELVPFHRPAETQPVWLETISTPAASFDQVNSFLPATTQQPTWSNSLITALDSCSSPLFLGEVSTNIELLGELFAEAGRSSKKEELPPSSIKRLNSEDFEPGLSDILSMNFEAESSIEAVQMSSKQIQELEQYPSHFMDPFVPRSLPNSNIIVADDGEAVDINNFFTRDDARDLESILNEEPWDWSLPEEIFPL